jgi:exonuclease III
VITDDEWIWKRNMKIGTWNERSLFWPGAQKVLPNELSNLDFDVVALQETRLENGIKKFGNFTIYRWQDEVREDGRIVGGEE